ncbi:hypothetical protein Tco_0490750 [Tanacetum coccineum]
MLESNAYKTYYAFASGKKTLKPKYVQKKADPNTSPKQKPVQATKAEQLKLATEKSKTQFHSSYASGSGDGVDTQSKVPDEQQQKSSGIDEGIGTIPGVPDVPIYESKSKKESWGDNDDEDNENDSDDISNEGDDDNDGNDGDDDDANDDDKEEGDDTNDDDEVTNSDRTESNRFEQVEEDAHVTLTLVLDTQKADEHVQSSSVSSDFTSKLLNLKNPSLADNEIALLMETSARHATAVPENTSSFTTTIPPPPPFFNPLPQQAIKTPTPTTSEATTSFPSLLDFSSVFRFNDRVTNLEKDLLEIRQVDQYAQVLSSIPAIVDRYMDNKLGKAINKAILAHNLDFRQEAQVSDFANHVIEKNVTEPVEYAVLTRSSSQPTSTYEAAASLSEFELTKILIDKMEKNKSYDKADYKKKLYDVLMKKTKIETPLLDQTEGQKEGNRVKMLSPSKIQGQRKKKSLSTFRDASQSQHKSFGMSAHEEEPSHTVEDSGMQQDQEFVTGDNDEQPADKEVTKVDVTIRIFDQ